MRRPAAASLTAAIATIHMLLRPPHSRFITPAATTGRDSTARYSAMRGPTAAWRGMAQGRPHQEAIATSLRSRLLSLDDQDGNEESPRDGSAHGQAEHVASGDEMPDRRSCGSDQNHGQPIKRQQKNPPTASRPGTTPRRWARAGLTLQRRRGPCYAGRSRRPRCPTFPKRMTQ